MNLLSAIPLVLALVAVVEVEPTTVDRGRNLYFLHCARCHGPQAMGDGPEGDSLRRRPPDLRHGRALGGYSDAELTKRIRDSRMLPLEFDPEAARRTTAESEAIYGFLTRLPKLRWRQVDRGREIFLDRCAECHGFYGIASSPSSSAGTRKQPRSLADSEFQAATDDRTLGELVRHGKDGMPALTPGLDRKQAADVVSFVRLLSPGFELYETYCTNCHGMHGEGAAGTRDESAAPRTAFDRSYFRKRDPDMIRDAIWHMLREAKPTMPHFRVVLSVEEVRAILSYLRSLRPLSEGRPGSPRPSVEAVPAPLSAGSLRRSSVDPIRSGRGFTSRPDPE